MTPSAIDSSYWAGLVMRTPSRNRISSWPIWPLFSKVISTSPANASAGSGE